MIIPLEGVFAFLLISLLFSDSEADMLEESETTLSA
jgi:hypothetical protein